MCIHGTLYEKIKKFDCSYNNPDTLYARLRYVDDVEFMSCEMFLLRNFEVFFH